MLVGEKDSGMDAAFLSGALYVVKANINMAFLVFLLIAVTWIITSVVKAVWKD